MISHAEAAALITAVGRYRDRAAFTRLFDHFAPRLQGYLLRLGADPVAAEEITQDVMATLWRKAALFDANKSSPSTWIYRIARNRRIDALRRDRLDFVEIESALLDRPDETDLDRAVDEARSAKAVRDAIETLPPEQLTLVKLAFFDGLSHSEIAAQTGVPLGTVKSRLRLAFTRLRRELEAQGIVEVP